MEKSDGDKSSSPEDGSQLNRNRSFKSKQLVRSQAIRESHSPPRTVSPAAVTTDNLHDNIARYNYAAAKTIDNSVRNNVKVSETLLTAVSLDITNVSNDKLNDSVANVHVKAANVNVKDANENVKAANVNVKDSGETNTSSQESDDSNSHSVNVVGNNNKNKQQVEIQISGGAWDEQTAPAASEQQRLRARRWLGHKQPPAPRDLLSNNPRVACVCGTCANCPHCRGRKRRPLCPTKQDSGIVCSDDCPDCCDTEHAGQIDVVPKAGSLDDDTHYCRCPERKDRTKNISLGGTDSDAKSELTGVDLVNFIKDTLNRNGRDRMTLLRIERELHALINDTGRCVVRFPAMTSYGRMLVHRCAALFQLSHHLDGNFKNSVLVSKSGTSGGRIPCTSFRHWCTVNLPPSSPQRRTPDHINAKSILKRDAHSLDEPGSLLTSAVRSKSLEQRERDYERVRNKIFNSDTGSCDESDWLTGPVKVLTADAGRNKLLKVHSLETSSGTQWCGAQQWDRRGTVAKSHSFGGYGQPDPPRMLSRHGDLASSSWRLSPSSSGYRTLSLHSADSVTPSPTDGASPEPSGGAHAAAVVWAVTDISSVPLGAVVIHPQTGRALTNPDGSVYHFDPNNPPVLYDANYVASDTQQREQNNDKRRGRLEKQHSIADTGCECKPNNENQTKCCCDCRQKTSKTYTENKPTKNPTSPSKNRLETSTPTNENTTNHRQPYLTTSKKEDNYESYSNSTNQHQEPCVSLKQFESTNERQESQYESTNQKFDAQKSYDRYDSQKYEPTNQKPGYESANQMANKLTNQDCQEYGTHYYGNYPQNYRHDELTSPSQAQSVHYMQTPDLTMMQAMHPVPVATPEHNLRGMPLTGVIYPGVQHYPYQVRVDQPVQEYQQVAPAPPTDDHKATPAHIEQTFTIDPSYPYAPVDYSQCSTCTSCADHTLQAPPSYPVPYAAEPQPQLPYPMANVMIPHAHAHPPPALPYTYQDQLQWPIQLPVQPMGQMPLPVPIQNPTLGQHGPKAFEVYHMVPPAVMPHGAVPYVYPHTQLLPQPYQLCQPMYPAVLHHQRRGSVSSQRTKRNSTSGSSRATPLQTPTEDKKSNEDSSLVPYSQSSSHHNRDSSTPQSTGVTCRPNNVSRQNSNDIAAKIQQIKDQMSHLNTGNRSGTTNPIAGKPDWKRRNSGNGILGSYPNAGYNGRVLQPTADDSQLSTAARAIVNSIRTMHNKGNQNQDSNRPDQKQTSNQYYQHNNTNQTQHYQHNNTNTNQVQQHQHNNNRRRQDENRGSLDGNELRRSQPAAVPFQYRPPYLLRQMSPGTWCRGSPGPVHPVLNQSRRPYPDSRYPRRQT